MDQTDKHNQEQIIRTLTEIKSALLGDEFHPEGLLKRVDKLDKRLEATEKKVDRMDKKIFGYVSLATGFLTAISFALKSLFK